MKRRRTSPWPIARSASDTGKRSGGSAAGRAKKPRREAPSSSAPRAKSGESPSGASSTDCLPDSYWLAFEGKQLEAISGGKVTVDRVHVTRRPRKPRGPGWKLVELPLPLKLKGRRISLTVDRRWVRTDD